MLKLCKSYKISQLNSERYKKFKFKQFVAYNSNYKDLEAAYVPSRVERQDLDINYFNSPHQRKECFSLILPPPNITGNLHLGHALTGTMQDILVRWKRMQGFETIWLPGLDHAGIATQVIVEKQLLKKEQKTRHNIGREKFLERIWNWKTKNAGVIGDQLKRLGLSLNWEKQVFTMDPVQAKIVSQVFVSLFEKGLIFRDEALVNWSCFLRSTISDIEVNHLEVDGSTEINVPCLEKPVKFGKMFYVGYKIADSDDEIIVATTRPETILGDVAVAVHPLDERYTKFVGRKVYHPFRQEDIPIIADEFVDMNFGTGAVKITPAHDHADFSTGKRHSLPILPVFDENGNITNISNDFQGLNRFEARDLIVNRVSNMKLLRDVKDHKMLVPICSRSGDIVEYMLRPQWFVRCTEMARRAVNDVKQGNLVIEPKNFEVNWFDWLENIHDWCISRQLWWGHRIPAYLCRVEDKEQWIVATEMDLARKKASEILNVCEASIEIEQDCDVLDTWFSSALLPFSVFGWPNRTDDFSKYYPLSLMETGHDILFFWVARMVMLGTEITGQLPFKKILLHGIICDSQGRKMSKSLGNVISPENVIEGIPLKDLNQVAKDSEQAGVLSQNELKKTLVEQKKMFPEGIPECGVDALRYTLVSHNVKSHFINFDVQECYTNKLFCNKLWQATKFTRIYYDQVLKNHGVEKLNQDNIGTMDRWILSRYSHLMQVLNDSMEVYDFHVATLALKNFLYYEFCDVYLETTKRALRENEHNIAFAHCWTLITILDKGLRALHPFMPYVTEYLHRRLPLLDRKYSSTESTPWSDKKLEEDVTNILEIVKGIRRLKSMFNVTKKHNALVQIVSLDSEYHGFKGIIEDLSKCNSIVFQDNIINQQNGSILVKDTLSNKVTIYLSIPENLRTSLQMDQKKLERQKENLTKELSKMNRMISGSTYELNVTLDVQKLHEKKVAVLEEKIARIDYVLSIL